jgi:hypothetical protein
MGRGTAGRVDQGEGIKLAAFNGSFDERLRTWGQPSPRRAETRRGDDPPGKHDPLSVQNQ